MKALKSLLIIAISTLILNQTIKAQCPAGVASLGVGNGLQICWPTGEAPTTLDSIVYDGIAYTGTFVSAGQGDCWRTDVAATLDVNGNHTIEIIINGIPASFCTVEDGVVSNPMPITLAYFGAAQQGQTVAIEWQTMEEENNDYFLVERSLDGVDFEVIDKIFWCGHLTRYSVL